jgi:hypothetical protein
MAVCSIRQGKGYFFLDETIYTTRTQTVHSLLVATSECVDQTRHPARKPKTFNPTGERPEETEDAIGGTLQLKRLSVKRGLGFSLVELQRR